MGHIQWTTGGRNPFGQSAFMMKCGLSASDEAGWLGGQNGGTLLCSAHDEEAADEEAQ
jgi:hypothetical protein